MGVYLSKPIIEKISEQGENNSLYWSTVGMQGKYFCKGWRIKMEDSHIASDSLSNGVSIFGVFDGHGGQEVALYVK